MIKVYSFNDGYYTDLGVYPLEAQFEMLKEIGFDGIRPALYSNQAYDELEKISV